MGGLAGGSGAEEVKMEGVCARVDEVERWGGCGMLKIGYGDALLLDNALTGSKMPLLL